MAHKSTAANERPVIKAAKFSLVVLSGYHKMFSMTCQNSLYDYLDYDTHTYLSLIALFTIKLHKIVNNNTES